MQREKRNRRQALKHPLKFIIQTIYYSKIFPLQRWKIKYSAASCEVFCSERKGLCPSQKAASVHPALAALVHPWTSQTSEYSRTGIKLYELLNLLKKFKGDVSAFLFSSHYFNFNNKLSASFNFILSRLVGFSIVLK